MKTLFIFCFSLFQFYTLTAQKRPFNNDSIIEIIYVKTATINGFSSANKSKLLVTDSVSYYFISNPGYELEEQRPYAMIIKNINANSILFNGPMPPRFDRTNYFYDTLFAMKWKITNKTKVFNGRIGYEAVTNFRGRTWNAYYDPLIPINDGPMKFGGLPGLIIKLYDSDKIFEFDLFSIQKKANNFRPNKISIAGDFELFKATYPAWRKRINAILNANRKIDANCLDCNNAISTGNSPEPIYEPTD